MGGFLGRLSRLLLVACLMPAAALAGAAGPARPAGADADRLDMFRLRAGRPVVARLVREGYDVAATRPVPGGLEADLVLSPAERQRLAASGLTLDPWRNAEGLTARELLHAAAGAYTVWRSFDEPGGLRDEMDELARDHPRLVQRHVIGHSVEGRELIALRVTARAPDVPVGARPAVLHLSLQHAREWISVEVNRRLLRSYVDGYGTDPHVTGLLDSRELWFVLVANPDGYERTFRGDRLWRKTTRDNDGDGRVTLADGVDLNRNFPDHWGLDPEGSSGRHDSQSYRGPAAASEPETQALIGLMQRVPFRFLINYHAYGRLLLYPFGWQEQTPAADQPIYQALAGTPASPAIPGYHPQLSTELYVTNGETTSWAHAAVGTLGFTPELGEGLPGNGFLFPDNEALVRQEYEINRPFALDLARSADDPSRPRSHLRHTALEIVTDPFGVSYGDPQPVQATVARHLGPVTMHYRVNSGPTVDAPTEEWAGGTRYGGPGDVHYGVVRGIVAGGNPGDRVEVWFEAGGQRSNPFTYLVESDGPAPVLVVAGGDHSHRLGSLVGAPPEQELSPELPSVKLPSLEPPAAGDTPPDTASSTTDGRVGPVLEALAAAGVSADVYDVDGHGHVPPHPLGVLSHYEAVVWTADEFEPGVLPGTVSRLANAEMLAARAYLNEGGRLLYTGRRAGAPYADGAEYDPDADGPCSAQDHGEDGCVPLSDDFFQYWLGAYDHVDGGGSTPDARIARVDGVGPPFEALSWVFAGAGVAPERSTAAFVPVAEALDPAEYPQLSGRASARYSRSGTAGTPLPDAAAVTTDAGILFGFGFEDVDRPERRADVMTRALRHLLPGRL